LIQDTAYESLLKSKRKQLHQRVAGVLTKEFPGLRETQPELLAYHSEAAGLMKEALSMWEKAGHKAIQQSSTFAAINHFQRALSLIKFLDREQERNSKELAILLPLMGILGLAKGYGAAELEKTGSRIVELCEKLNDNTQTCIGIWALSVVIGAGGRFDDAKDYTKRGLALSERISEKDFSPLFRGLLSEWTFLLGEFDKTIEYCETTIRQYQPEKHRFLEDIGGGDVWLWSNWFVVFILILGGHIDQAKNLVGEMQVKKEGEIKIINLYRIFSVKFWFHFLTKDWKKAQEEINGFLPLASESGELASMKSA
jgi:tetratricopeptide (TPR) repeat protein